jgi:hypothetical protein
MEDSLSVIARIPTLTLLTIMKDCRGSAPDTAWKLAPPELLTAGDTCADQGRIAIFQMIPRERDSSLQYVLIRGETCRSIKRPSECRMESFLGG